METNKMDTVASEKRHRVQCLKGAMKDPGLTQTNPHTWTCSHLTYLNNLIPYMNQAPSHTRGQRTGPLAVTVV